MDPSTIGSINQYAKGLALKTQWKLKKQSGDVTSHKKSLNDFISANTVSIQQQKEQDSEKLGKITAKVNAGAKLTEKEMDYLKEKNPQLYEKLRQIEKEQKEYEEALRHCKSRDEVQRLHMARVSESMQAAKNGDGTAAYRMNRMTESMTAFTETDEYKKLSTEAEQALERQEQREAERAELQPEDEHGTGTPETRADDSTEKRADIETKEPASEYKAAARDEKAPDAETGQTPEWHHAAPAGARFGTQAYISQQEADSREEHRRKPFDMEA